MSKIVLLACSKSKQQTNVPIKASQLYTGQLFKKSYNYACQMTPAPDKIFILSAKHHVLEPNDKIAYYNLFLGNLTKSQRIVWANNVLNQLKEKGCDLQNDEFIILAGKDYYQYIRPQLPNSKVPMEGMRIGQMLQYLTNIP